MSSLITNKLGGKLKSKYNKAVEKAKILYWKNQEPPKRGEYFTDPLFPPNLTSLNGNQPTAEVKPVEEGKEESNELSLSGEAHFNPDKIIWMRAKDIFKGQPYLLFEDRIEMADIAQGSIGDCYFLASVAALTEYPNLIYNIFVTKEVNKYGYFELKFFIDGKWQIVVVDDYLPVLKSTGKIAFAKPNKNEIWVCLLEKAWAKINGCYTNIIKGWMRHVLTALTGFSHTTFCHSNTDKEKLWKEISLADFNSSVMSSSSRPDVKNTGLVLTHAYTLIGVRVIKSKGKNVRLVRLRNTWGCQEWKGDWSDKSELWGEEEKAQVEDYCKMDDGAFYMSFDDYFKSFIVTDICYIIYSGYGKIFNIEKKNYEEINNGQVFNIYLEEDGMFAASVIRRMWRFHREIKDKCVPTTLILFKYDTCKDEKEMITDYQGAFGSFEDISITKNLTKGFYCVYVYQDWANSQLKDEEYYVVKFDSTVKFKYKKMTNDFTANDLPFLRKINILSVLQEKGKNYVYEPYISWVNNYKNSGIGHKIHYNSNGVKSQQIQDDSTNLKNLNVIAPNNVHGKFEYYVEPKSFNALLVLQFNSSEGYHFKTNPKTFLVTKKAEIDQINLLNLEDYLDGYLAEEKITDVKSYYDYQTMSEEEAASEYQFEILDMSSLTVDAVKKKEPEIMEKLLALKPTARNKSLTWCIKKIKGNKYVGQMNNCEKKEGRGAYVTDSEVYIGYFNENEKNGKAFCYNTIKDKEPSFKGEYVDGLKEGFAVVKYKNGDMFEGEYVKGKRSGIGKYTFKSGAIWEGPFVDDKMDGEGTYIGKNGGGKKKVVYSKGCLKK